ncbi:hypothetical protein ACIBVL_12625 [Streptomyces sp. NPDC049687]|uniref:hypothetical protein n=1 Tax=Streptomyces sp. NPDC049687 TaxID=3365596 RepID=UPI00379F93AC
MTPWRRGLCAVGVGAVLVLPAGGYAYGTASTYGVVSASATPAPSSPEPDRAGSRAGEGRARPGRADEDEAEDEVEDEVEDEDAGQEEGADEDGTVDSPDESDASAEPEPDADADAVTESPGDGAVAPVGSEAPQDGVGRAAAQGERAEEPVLRILPLGSGLVLIGLGLALGLAALRLRRS